MNAGNEFRTGAKTYEIKDLHHRSDAIGIGKLRGAAARAGDYDDDYRGPQGSRYDRAGRRTRHPRSPRNPPASDR
jgi:hypothetical protein